MKRLGAALLITLLCVTAAFEFYALESADYSGREFLSEYAQTLYGEDTAIPVETVKAILQTSDGFLWFGGYEGLFRFDGINAKRFALEDGFPSFNVNVLYEDSKNRLWIATNDKGVVLYENGTFTVYGTDAGLPSASVRGIAEDENGNICFVTTGGIAFISPGGALNAHPALDGVFALRVVYAGEGRFLCLLNDGSLVMFDREKFILEIPKEHFGQSRPSAVYLARDGVLYIGAADDKVFITDFSFEKYKTVAVSPLSSVSGFFEDSLSRIWVSSSNGAGYLENGAFVPVDGLIMSNQIECIYEDYEGNYWFGSTRSGLLRLVRAKLKNVSFFAGLPDRLVNTTAVKDGDLYIGTDSGLIILRGGVPIENELTQMLDGVRVRCIITDTSGRMWICAYERLGVVLVRNDNSVVSITPDEGLVSERVRFAAEASNGDIYIGTNNGISVIRGESVIKNYTKADGLDNDYILSFAEDKDGVIYFGSDGGGIYALDGDKITNYSEKDGLASGIIMRMSPAGGGVLVSTGNDICYLERSGVRVLDNFPLYAESAFDIILKDDEVWFLCTNSIKVCDLNKLLSGENPIKEQFRRRDGLSSSITANSWNTLTDSGELYISTSASVFVIDTGDIIRGETVPLAEITGVYADGEQILPQNGVYKISRDLKRLDIHIALLSFASKDGEISYFLEGFDEGYTTVRRDEVSYVSYTNLSGGMYTFRLYGVNADGLRSEAAAFTIHKQQRFYEIPIVRVMSAIILLASVFLCARSIISRKVKTLETQRQKYKDVAGQIMELTAKMTDLKEGRSKDHSRRVADYSRMVGERLGMSEEELETLYYAALMHDIGLVSTPESILNKKGKLTEEEFEKIKKHVDIGGGLLNDITVMGDISFGAKYHHERIDGCGYKGLSSDEIPFAAKIITVCNAFDSMLSPQAYRPALSVEKAQSEFIANAGKQFDERITAVLISLINEGEAPIK